MKERSPGLLVETLLGDFQGNLDTVAMMAHAGMDVYAHNVETVERLTPRVRDYRAKYKQSLDVLEFAKKSKPDLVTKTSLMLGLGETHEDIMQAMRDIKNAGVEILTFGQYLQPTKYHMKVTQFISPEEFDLWRVEGEKMGFSYVASGPMVRSSYRAGEFFTENLVRKRQAEKSTGTEATF